MRLAQLDRAFGYGPKGRGFESSNARHIKNGTGHKVLSHFLFESSRTRTGSIYISFRLRSTPVGLKPTSTGCCKPLLNACHRHAATSNARLKRIINRSEDIPLYYKAVFYGFLRLLCERCQVLLLYCHMHQ